LLFFFGRGCVTSHKRRHRQLPFRIDFKLASGVQNGHQSNETNLGNELFRFHSCHRSNLFRGLAKEIERLHFVRKLFTQQSNNVPDEPRKRGYRHGGISGNNGIPFSFSFVIDRFGEFGEYCGRKALKLTVNKRVAPLPGGRLSLGTNQCRAKPIIVEITSQMRSNSVDRCRQCK
jgi:hypothetical protein